MGRAIMSEQESDNACKGDGASVSPITILQDLHGNTLGEAYIQRISETDMQISYHFPLKMNQIVRFRLRNIGELSGEVVKAECNATIIRFHREIGPMALF